MSKTAEMIYQTGETWVKDNRAAYRHLRAVVERDWRSGNGQPIRLNYYAEWLRHEYKLSFSNDIRAYLARRIESELDSSKFNKNLGGVCFVKTPSKLDKLMGSVADK